MFLHPIMFVVLFSRDHVSGSKSGDVHRRAKGKKAAQQAATGHRLDPAEQTLSSVKKTRARTKVILNKI